MGGFRSDPGLLLHMNATDHDLDPLRDRVDFLGLVGDLLFPVRPFQE
jgi:hypothetical protein